MRVPHCGQQPPLLLPPWALSVLPRAILPPCSIHHFIIKELKNARSPASTNSTSLGLQHGRTCLPSHKEPCRPPAGHNTAEALRGHLARWQTVTTYFSLYSTILHLFYTQSSSASSTCSGCHTNVWLKEIKGWNWKRIMNPKAKGFWKWEKIFRSKIPREGVSW